MKPKTKTTKKYNDKIESLSKEQKEIRLIRLTIERPKNLENIIELKKKRNNIRKP